jgi:hypothetical protein
MPLRRLALTSSAILTSVLLAGTAAAVVWRADATEAEALALAARFPAVGRVLPDGTATLIAPTWMLTAAHVAARAKPGDEVELAGRRHRIARVIVHPAGKEPAPGTPPEVDLGLLELAQPVEGIAPLAQHRGRAEQGSTLTIVGCGDHAAAGAPRVHQDGRCRAITNRVDDAGPLRLFLRFDAPPAGTPLEGIGVAGDSGGPALIEVGGRWQVAGVSSGADGPPGAYGTVDVYARVSSFVGWLDEATSQQAMRGAQSVQAKP